MTFLEQAERLIRLKSVSHEGNEEVSFFLQDQMQRLGMKTVLQPVTHSLDGVSKRQANVFGILGDPLVDSKTRKGLLLVSHSDTTAPGIFSHWTETNGDPFQFVVKDGRVYGLGVANAKLDILCKLKAVERFRGRVLKRPVYVAATAGGELGYFGSRFLLKSLALNPAAVVVGEPTGLELGLSQKGHYFCRFLIYYSGFARDAKGYNTRIQMRCTGRSGHAAQPDLSQNALDRMFDLLGAIQAAKFTFRAVNFLGGELGSRVPDTASVSFYIQSSAFDDFKKFFHEHLYAKGVEVEFGGLGESGLQSIPESVIDAMRFTREGLVEVTRNAGDAENSTFVPPGPTCSLIAMKCGPGWVEMAIDIRPLPTVSAPAGEPLEVLLQKLVEKVNSKFSNLSMKMNRVHSMPPLKLDPEQEFIKLAFEAQKAAGIPQVSTGLSAATEAILFANAGYLAVPFGPGLASGVSHAPNEFNFVEHLDRAILFYDRLIERTCL